MAVANFVLAMAAWPSASSLRWRVSSIFDEIRAYQPPQSQLRRVNAWNIGENRWDLIQKAPLFGHGTGSIRDQFRRSIAGQGRSDLDRVDGFDADRRGWGKEIPTLSPGFFMPVSAAEDGIFATSVIHLWHPEVERPQLAPNEGKLADVLAGGRVRALRGLSSLQGTSTTAARAT